MKPTHTAMGWPELETGSHYMWAHITTGMCSSLIISDILILKMQWRGPELKVLEETRRD